MENEDHASSVVWIVFDLYIGLSRPVQRESHDLEYGWVWPIWLTCLELEPRNRIQLSNNENPDWRESRKRLMPINMFKLSLLGVSHFQATQSRILVQGEAAHK